MNSDGPESLGEQIAKAKAAREKASADAKAREDAGVEAAGAMALRYGAEFGASVFIGILMGLGIDHVAGTEPWGLLVMLGFGLAAGVLNMVRAYREMTERARNIAEGPGGSDDGKTG